MAGKLGIEVKDVPREIKNLKEGKEHVGKVNELMEKRIEKELGKKELENLLAQIEQVELKN